jgi:dTDP-4-amino-4,6-dideoxygalactose transaminase
LTNDKEIRDTVWSLRDHGRNRERTLSNDHPFGFRWLQERFGTNGRMTEMQSAIGRCQLKKVDSWTQERNDNAMVFTDFFDSVEGINVPLPPKNIKHAYFRFTALFDDGERRNSIVEKLQMEGILAAVGPCPEIYKEEAFSDVEFNVPASLPIAEDLGKRTMTLLVHPGMKPVMNEIISRIAPFFT